MAPTLLLKVDRAEPWVDGFHAEMPELTLRMFEDLDPANPPTDIDYAFCWRPPPGVLAGLPGLRAIFSAGAGVDQLLEDATFPRSVPLVRVVDPEMTQRMTEFAVLCVLAEHRELRLAHRQQQQGVWQDTDPPPAWERRVGVMGLGQLGAAAAQAIAALGFPVAGWARGPKTIEGVEVFHGRDGLDGFLARTDILVNLLPLTPETEDIIDAGLLARLPRGARVVNLARGRHVVEDDLLAALNDGHIGGATLDVFRTEPLPEGHPFWSHPAVTVSPHIASVTRRITRVRLVVENIRRMEAGQPPTNRVDVARGY